MNGSEQEIIASQLMVIEDKWAELLSNGNNNIFIIQGQLNAVESLTKVVQNMANISQLDTVEELAERIADTGVQQNRSLKSILELVEVACIKKFLGKSGGNIRKAERLARISRGKLYSRKRVLGIDLDDAR